MAINDISQYFTLDNGTQIANDSTFASLAANTRIKNKNSGSTFIKNSNYSNVFDRVSTFAEFIKATDFKITNSGSGNGVASISYTPSTRTVTQTLTTFATPAELNTASNNLKSQAVGSISVSGRTVTYKNINGQVLGTFQTQDNDTTYSAGSGLSLSGTTFNVTSTAGNSNLQWNSEVTLGTVGGFAIKAKLPANPNTNISYYAGDGLSLNGTTFSLALTSSHITNALGYTPAREGSGGGGGTLSGTILGGYVGSASDYPGIYSGTVGSEYNNYELFGSVFDSYPPGTKFECVVASSASLSTYYSAPVYKKITFGAFKLKSLGNGMIRYLFTKSAPSVGSTVTSNGDRIITDSNSVWAENVSLDGVSVSTGNVVVMVSGGYVLPSGTSFVVDSIIAKYDHPGESGGTSAGWGGSYCYKCVVHAPS